MKLSTRLGLSLVALSLIALTRGQAQAQVVNGTFGFVPIGSVTYTGQSLDTATAITMPALEIVNNVGAPTYLGSANQFNSGPMALTPGQSVTLNQVGFASLFAMPVLANNALYVSPFITFVAGSQTFSYTVTQVTSFVGTSTPPGASLAFNTTGMLTSTGTTNQVAQLSGSFTQTGPGSAVNGSFTFSTSTASVPEPSSLALVLSLGMTGAGFLARRRMPARNAE